MMLVNFSSGQACDEIPSRPSEMRRFRKCDFREFAMLTAIVNQQEKISLV
jgi:hypothetical protein